MQTMEKDNNVGLNSFLETLNTAYAFTWKVMSDDCMIYKKKDWLIRTMNNFSSFFFRWVPKKHPTLNWDRDSQYRLY